MSKSELSEIMSNEVISELGEEQMKKIEAVAGELLPLRSSAGSQFIVCGRYIFNVNSIVAIVPHVKDKTSILPDYHVVLREGGVLQSVKLDADEKAMIFEWMSKNGDVLQKPSKLEVT